MLSGPNSMTETASAISSEPGVMQNERTKNAIVLNIGQCYT